MFFDATMVAKSDGLIEFEISVGKLNSTVLALYWKDGQTSILLLVGDIRKQMNKW